MKHEVNLSSVHCGILVRLGCEVGDGMPHCVFICRRARLRTAGWRSIGLFVWGSLGAHARGPLGLCDDVVGHLRGVPVAQATKYPVAKGLQELHT